MNKRKPLEIDGIFGSSLRDTQGEVLDIEGADISELEAGRGRFNDNHGKSFSSIVGRVTFAKKIFKAEDCDDDRQKYYWDKITAPYIYGRGYLFDDEDHSNARAAAAILRNIHKTDSPLKLKFSVEGGVIARGVRDPSILARTKIHSCALTFVPANNATLVEPLNLDKTATSWETDLILIKSVLHLAETNVPSFRHIARDASASKVQHNLAKLVSLMKDLGIEGDLHIPSKQKILEKAIEHKIHKNIIEIKDMMKSINDQDMEKSIGKNVAAAALSATAALSPMNAQTPAPDPVAVEQKQVAQIPQHEKVYQSVSKQYPLLGAIGMKESSGGKNINHKTVEDKKSSQYGHTAGGTFGMMPNTAAYIVKQDSELANKYPELAEASKDMKSNHKMFTDKFNSDPEVAAEFAIALMKRNKGKTKNDQQLAYSWLNGLKGSWNKYHEGGMKSIQEHPYVQDVMKELEKLQPQKAQQKKPLEKALMAGYGGAGAPTSMTGGNVVQSESLDDGRPRFKYVTCDNCGKEQIHAKHQIKCRSCGTSFSLEKLYNLLARK
jgi:ribosomal protein S27E